MFKRFALALGIVLALSVSLVGSHLTSASAHSAVSSHANTVDVAAKKRHHHHHYSGISVASPIQQNDAGKPTTFTVVGKGLTPNGFYDIHLTDLEDRCLAATAIGLAETPADDGVDNGDIQADLEGRLTFTVEIFDCVAGTYSITLVNDALSGESHEVHFHIKAA